MQTIDEPRILNGPESAKLKIEPVEVGQSDVEGAGEKKAALRFKLQEDLTEMPSSRLKNAASVPSLAIQNLARQVRDHLLLVDRDFLPHVWCVVLRMLFPICVRSDCGGIR